MHVRCDLGIFPIYRPTLSLLLNLILDLRTVSILNWRGLVFISNNMSYGAAVGASTANSNEILKNLIFIPVLNKSYVHCVHFKVVY